MRRAGCLQLSGGLVGLATAGFVLLVGASADALVLLLFAGFWIGLHAFLGFVRLSKRLEHAVGLTELLFAEYERLMDLAGGREPHSEEHYSFISTWRPVRFRPKILSRFWADGRKSRRYWSIPDTSTSCLRLCPSQGSRPMRLSPMLFQQGRSR